MTNLASTYVHLGDEGRARLEPVTPEFWPALLAAQRPDLDSGRLVMVFHFDGDWPTWEMHPAGDELVVLISGSAELILHLEGGDVSHHLSSPGDFAVVPRGVWHTARHSSPTAMLFATPGEGTENRATPPL